MVDCRWRVESFARECLYRIEENKNKDAIKVNVLYRVGAT